MISLVLARLGFLVRACKQSVSTCMRPLLVLKLLLTTNNYNDFYCRDFHYHCH